MVNLPSGINIKPRHKWSTEELEWLRSNYPIYVLPELLVKFNEHFNTDITKTALKGILDKYKIHCGRKSQWVKGQTAWNKGMTWDDYMTDEGQIKSRKTCFNTERTVNNANYNDLPVGTEYVWKGYIIVKTDKSEGTKARRWWKLKHHLVWEQAHGPIPKDHNVIFLDGNNRNFDLDNLALVNDAELAIMNKNKLYFKGNADATKCGVSLTKLIIKRSQYAKKQINRSK